MEYHIFFSNIIVHVGVLAIFLTIFFFTFAVNVEKTIVSNQISFIVQDIVHNIFKGAKPENKEKILKKLDVIFSQMDFTEVDNQVKQSNNKILMNSIKFIGIILGVVILLISIIAYINKWNSEHLSFLIIGAFVTLICVAVTEISFLLLIASNYLSADPNKIREKIIDEIFLNRK